MFNLNSVIIVSEQQVSSVLGEEVVILELKSGVYYGLNAVGSSIWSLIQEPKTVEEIYQSLLTEYNVDPQECEQDLLTLLQRLKSEGLIELKNETTTT